MNLLSEIDRKLEALAAEMLAGEGSTQLDIQGAYTADFTVAGTWKEPQVNFKFEGNDWKWHPQKAFPAIVKPLGLVMEELQVIPVEQVLVQGGYEDGTIKVEPARVRIGDTVLAFAGNLSPQESEQNSEFIVENLSLDLVRYFVEIPLDIAGNINAKGNLGGSLVNPQVKGEFAFVEGAVNAKAIDEAIAGNFSYADSRLEFRTTSPESIQVYASVPYPVQPEVNDRVKVDIKLGTEAIALLGDFTQGQLQWIDGEGEVTLNGSGRLDLNEQVRLSDVAVGGKINLSEAALKSAAFPEVLKVSGQIALNNQLLKVEQLEGTIANKKLSVTGILPLFQPLGQSHSSNPLTIAIEQGEMELEGLYKGGIDGKVVITGAAIAPAIGGEIRLQNGRAFLPEEKATNVEEVSAAFYKWSGLVAGKTGAAVVPRLNNFRVVLDGLGIEQEALLFSNLFKFSFAGALTLNGALDNLDNLQPEGTIRLERGEIDLGTTQLFLAHRYDNRIDFVPQRGLFNPNLDIQLKTFLFDVSLVSVNRNEVRDDIVKSGRAKTIELTVTIDGKVNDLLPSLGKEVSEVCQIRADNTSPISEQAGFSPAEFQQLATCIDASVFESAIEDKSELELLQQLLFMPIVEIDSSPTLSLSEIIALFGKQLASQFESKFPFLVESLQEQNQEQLLEFGVTQVLIGPLLQRFGFEANEAVNSVVEKFGLKNFRVFPIVEAIYQVDGESFVGISYDYNFNEVKVRYEIEF